MEKLVFRFNIKLKDCLLLKGRIENLNKDKRNLKKETSNLRKTNIELEKAFTSNLSIKEEEFKIDLLRREETLQKEFTAKKEELTKKEEAFQAEIKKTKKEFKKKEEALKKELTKKQEEKLKEELIKMEELFKKKEEVLKEDFLQEFASKEEKFKTAYRILEEKFKKKENECAQLKIQFQEREGVLSDTISQLKDELEEKKFEFDFKIRQVPEGKK